jgi:hypothetical protein
MISDRICLSLVQKLPSRYIIYPAKLSMSDFIVILVWYGIILSLSIYDYNCAHAPQ